MATGEGSPAGPARPRTLLVVDDQRAVATALAERLSSHGYRTLEAYEPEGALRLAAERRPDLVIVDVVLPSPGGVALASRLDELGLPVILTSGYVDELALGRGVHFIAKPFDIAALVAMIERVLAR